MKRNFQNIQYFITTGSFVLGMALLKPGRAMAMQNSPPSPHLNQAVVLQENNRVQVNNPAQGHQAAVNQVTPVRVCIPVHVYKGRKVSESVKKRPRRGSPVGQPRMQRTTIQVEPLDYGVRYGLKNLLSLSIPLNASGVESIGQGSLYCNPLKETFPINFESDSLRDVFGEYYVPALNSSKVEENEDNILALLQRTQEEFFVRNPNSDLLFFENTTGQGLKIDPLIHMYEFIENSFKEKETDYLRIWALFNLVKNEKVLWSLSAISDFEPTNFPFQYIVGTGNLWEEANPASFGFVPGQISLEQIVEPLTEKVDAKIDAEQAQNPEKVISIFSAKKVGPVDYLISRNDRFENLIDEIFSEDDEFLHADNAEPEKIYRSKSYFKKNWNNSCSDFKGYLLRSPDFGFELQSDPQISLRVLEFLEDRPNSIQQFGTTCQEKELVLKKRFLAEEIERRMKARGLFGALVYFGPCIQEHFDFFQDQFQDFVREEVEISPNQRFKRKAIEKKALTFFAETYLVMQRDRNDYGEAFEAKAAEIRQNSPEDLTQEEVVDRVIQARENLVSNMTSKFLRYYQADSGEGIWLNKDFHCFRNFLRRQPVEANELDGQELQNFNLATLMEQDNFAESLNLENYRFLYPVDYSQYINFALQEQENFLSGNW